MSTRRLRACVERWPECETGEYNPACCRFPKSCSCDIYDPEYVTEDDFEPAPVADTDPESAGTVPLEQVLELIVDDMKRSRSLVLRLLPRRTLKWAVLMATEYEINSLRRTDA